VHGVVTAARKRGGTTPASPGFAELRGGDASAVLVPSLGGKIRDLTLAGRQWLWHNAALPFAAPPNGASFAESGDSGGFDECFPTVAACRLPSWVKNVGSRSLPDHGELWSRQPEVVIVTDEHGHSAACAWTGRALPCRFSRKVTVRPDGTVAFDFAVTNTGDARIPFLWSSHPMFPLTGRSRIVLPQGARTRVWAQYGVELGRPGAEHRWPRLRVGAALVDFSRPAALKQDFACKLFVELPRTEVVVALEESGVRLEMHLHGRQVPQVGLWINRRGWAPFATPRSALPPFLRKKAAPYSNLAIAPCLGAPDTLSDALGAWDAAHWIEAGATARWSMWWRGVRGNTET